jgi:3-hydroxyisobutyrate dehydrogenase-like beta-hydroxyacid dehydrogenase
MAGPLRSLLSGLTHLDTCKTTAPIDSGRTTVSSESKKGPVAFVGVGQMGLPMATRLVQAGWDVIVADVRKEAVAEMVARGARAAASPAEAASLAETVLLSLPVPDIVRQVALGPGGVVEGTRRRVVVDLSTTGPTVTQEIHAAFAEKGVLFIDAPVSGGVSGAAKGTLAVMAAGPKAECDTLEPLLRVFGPYFYIGAKPGSGQMMKLCNNLLSATHQAATAEAVVLGVKAGLDPDVMATVLNASSGRSTASEDKLPKQIITRAFNQGFALPLMAKDVNLCIAEAEKLGMPMWIGNSVKQMWNYGLSQGGPGQDCTEIIKHMEAWAGVQVGGQSTPRGS